MTCVVLLKIKRGNLTVLFVSFEGDNCFNGKGNEVGTNTLSFLWKEVSSLDFSSEPNWLNKSLAVVSIMVTKNTCICILFALIVTIKDLSRSWRVGY